RQCFRRRITHDFQARFVLVVFAAVAQRTAFGRAEFRLQYFAAFLLGPMFVLLALILASRLRTIWREGSAVRAFVVGAIVVAIPGLAILFWVPDLINVRIDDLTRYQARVLRVFRDSHAEAGHGRVNAVVAPVRSLAG